MKKPRGKSKQGKRRKPIGVKKEYFGSSRGVSFIYNSDFSGNVHVHHHNGTTCDVPFVDLVDFVVHMSKLGKKLST